MRIIVKNWSDLCCLLAASVQDMPLDEVQRISKDRRSPTGMLMRLMRVYGGASERSRRYGYVGVGCISFAQVRLVEYQERCARLALRRMGRVG